MTRSEGTLLTLLLVMLALVVVVVLGGEVVHALHELGARLDGVTGAFA